MSTNVTRPEKDTDRTGLTDTERRALDRRASGSYLGIDVKGEIHYFSMARRTITLFETAGDTDPRVIDLRELDIPDTPLAWAEVVAQKREGWLDLRLDDRYRTVLEVDR